MATGNPITHNYVPHCDITRLKASTHLFLHKFLGERLKLLVLVVNLLRLLVVVDGQLLESLEDLLHLLLSALVLLLDPVHLLLEQLVVPAS